VLGAKRVRQQLNQWSSQRIEERKFEMTYLIHSHDLVPSVPIIHIHRERWTGELANTKRYQLQSDIWKRKRRTIADTFHKANPQA
jgi:hypothetical protein